MTGDCITISGSSPPAQKTLEDKFIEFDRAFPRVLQKFHEVVMQLRKRGFQTYSPDAVMHVVRYEDDLIYGPVSGVQKKKKLQPEKVDAPTKTTEKTKLPPINDHFIRFYAAKLMKEFPEFRGFFRTMSPRTRFCIQVKFIGGETKLLGPYPNEKSRLEAVREMRQEGFFPSEWKVDELLKCNVEPDDKATIYPFTNLELL